VPLATRAAPPCAALATAGASATTGCTAAATAATACTLTALALEAIGTDVAHRGFHRIGLATRCATACATTIAIALTALPAKAAAFVGAGKAAFVADTGLALVVVVVVIAILLRCLLARLLW
jgi:hypothetical protein